ncbi:MAG: RNA-guided endonuclease TnpB family protein [Chloroflexi bacterium]|nr:RNA-guided endonuclease TnpB family protein [Chloroflexota bacterium]
MIVQKAFKFRIYPNHSQQAERGALWAKQFGAVRFVYNHYRAVREGYYLDTGSGLNYNDCAMDLADILKVDYPWLKEADSQTLQQALKDLDRAYKNFFEGRADYPHFHSKHDKQSIRYPQRFKVKDKRVYLPKVGWVKCVFHRAIEGAMKNCTVSKTKSGRYFVSIQVEIETEDPTPKAEAIGIDLGLTTFVTLSNEDKRAKPQHLCRSERRLQIRQRRLSRKVKCSKGRQKARLSVAKLHEHIANQRRDFQHKLSSELVSKYGSISFESLNIAGMVKNHRLAKAIADATWHQFVLFCAYKARWSGGQVWRVDRFFPSSQLCSDCGHKHKNLRR